MTNVRCQRKRQVLFIFKVAHGDLSNHEICIKIVYAYYKYNKYARPRVSHKVSRWINTAGVLTANIWQIISTRVRLLSRIQREGKRQTGPPVVARHWWIRVDWRKSGWLPTVGDDDENSGGALIAIQELINEYERDLVAGKSDVTTGDGASLR